MTSVLPRPLEGSVQSTTGPAFPWEERPPGLERRRLALEPQPVIPRDLCRGRTASSTRRSSRSATASPGVFRVDDTRRAMNLHAGPQRDGVDWEIDHEPIACAPADARVAEIQARSSTPTTRA